METNNRFAQVSWLRELAGDIANYGGEGTAEELIENAFKENHGPLDQLTVPSWFDEHDRRLLTRMVERRIA